MSSRLLRDRIRDQSLDEPPAGRSDPAASRQQWQRLYQTLCELGAAVDLLEPVAGLPDLVFTANAGIGLRNLFSAARFRFGVRQGETPHFEKLGGTTVSTLCRCRKA